ncbi:MAG: alanine--tRNA ligase, partial [Flavobacteriaceae bacterium]
GKHNDLEEVGMDTYHHTMFEMLGNWSFGDYFKKEAIEWAWELLTEVYNIDKSTLYVTIFEGDAAEGLEKDTDAYEIWRTLVDESQIIDGNKKDNFWEMGEQGPCGPCSEIHVDLRPKKERDQSPGAALVNQDHPLVVEIWNLVFMQFNRLADGSLEKLPAQHVDTGMGFERLCMVLQQKTSNYDTDVFTPLIETIESITDQRYGQDEKTDVAIRVIADHVRAVAFSIADGQLPSNSGAGYVIRRILRRAIRYGYTFLGTEEPFIYKLVATLTKMMGESFPELVREENLIYNVIKKEEISFLRTLAQGLNLLDQVIDSSQEKIISGAKAFELYDTYGFPIDLTALILRERGFGLDQAGFDQALEKQKTRSR